MYFQYNVVKLILTNLKRKEWRINRADVDNSDPLRVSTKDIQTGFNMVAHHFGV